MEIAAKWDEPAIRVLMMPRDTNAHGTIFGGVILSYIDQAGAIEARRQGCQFMVTVSMDKIVFHQPVFVGDLVSFYAEVVRVGRTSITVNVEVYAQRKPEREEVVKVTEATLTYVAVDENRGPRVVSAQQ